MSKKRERLLMSAVELYVILGIVGFGCLGNYLACIYSFKQIDKANKITKSLKKDLLFYKRVFEIKNNEIDELEYQVHCLQIELNNIPIESVIVDL